MIDNTLCLSLGILQTLSSHPLIVMQYSPTFVCFVIIRSHITVVEWKTDVMVNCTL